MFRKMLIANRGEIACRIARTLSGMNIAMATVHSDADADALHVQKIGESICIGAAPAHESYLDIDAVLDAARRVGADAIHPGFGFLAENPIFAQRCADAGITFIGPTAEALRLFGDKAASKAIARQLGIPTAGGSEEATDDVDRILDEVHSTPLPCIVKAAAGGGGKGMHIISDASEARVTIETAIREGRSAFGDGRVIIERYLTQPRHIEVQILGDGRGNVIHLYDRECSLQRRHQKVIEEAPVSSISDALRQKLWEHSVALGKSVNYLGLGTVEYAVSGEDTVFLEVNPRLQVEHPVTEAIVGLDLIELQIRAVAESRLTLNQTEVPQPMGYAVEARLYAEDATQRFLPSTGTIETFEVDPRVRVDAGVAAGCSISSHYDPMIAKLIAHGDTRASTLHQLRQAIMHTTVLGVTSNRSFLIDLLDMPQVKTGNIHTETIDEWLAATEKSFSAAADVASLMAVWRRRIHRQQASTNAWTDPALTGWRMRRSTMNEADIEHIVLRYEVKSSTGRWRVGFGATLEDGSWPVRVDDGIFNVKCVQSLDTHNELLAIDGQTLRLATACQANRAWASFSNRQLTLDIETLHHDVSDAGRANPGAVVAPMMGTIVAIHVEQGMLVQAGDRLATLESMKMELPIEATAPGTISWMGCALGGKVERNQELFRVSEVNKSKP